MLRLLPGQVIDGFTLVEPLHRGGMALLWRVTHSAHRQPLLMKVPLIAYGEGPGAIADTRLASIPSRSAWSASRATNGVRGHAQCSQAIRERRR